MRILIVEDEPLIALDIEGIVTGAGHEAIGKVATGSDAIGLAEQQRPDVVLMDIGLAGDMNGIDAAKTILDRCAIRSLFVSAVSSQSRDGADVARPFGFLLKPVDAAQLTRALHEIARQLGKQT